MKLTYEVVMFLILLIFCVGNVCAEEPDNITNDLDSSLPDAILITLLLI